MVALSPCGKKLGGVVLTCETDFVARNEDFLAAAVEMAKAFALVDPGSDPASAKVGDSTAGAMVEAAVAKIRENIQLSKAIHLETDGTWSTYVHHNKLKASAVEVEGNAANAEEVAHKVAIQCVAFPPEFLAKEEVPQDIIAKELEIETQRAINEGKDANIAKNIAQGRINKEFYKRVVLLEQPFYEDPNKSVGQYLAENGGIKVKRYVYLAVGG